MYGFIVHISYSYVIYPYEILIYTQAMINKSSPEKLKTQYEKLKQSFAFPRNVEVRG